MSEANFIGGGKSSSREKNDFYATPPEAVEALLRAVPDLAPGSTIWEPACGDGAIAEVLNIYGHNVHCTDLVRRMDNMVEQDFFTFDSSPLPNCDTIITNPPYQMVVDGKLRRVEYFINHCANIFGIKRFFLLLKTTAIAGQARTPILEASGLKTLYQFRHRISFIDKTKNMIDFAWFEFEVGYTKPPQIKWISYESK